MILHPNALIEEYTRAGHWGHRTLLDRLRENLAHCSGRTAVVDPPDRAELVGSQPRSVTWAELGRAADAVATALVDQGLRKDIIIRGGFNISAAEVENLALSHPGIADAAAVAVPDETLGERVCLCIVPRDPEDPPALADVTGFLREQGIASYKLPEALLRLAEIPRNPVGKVLKKDLRQRARDEADRTG